MDNESDDDNKIIMTRTVKENIKKLKKHIEEIDKQLNIEKKTPRYLERQLYVAKEIRESIDRYKCDNNIQTNILRVDTNSILIMETYDNALYVICTEDPIDVKVNECHDFCQSCTYSWLSANSICPICNV